MLAPTLKNIFGHPVPTPAPEVDYNGYPTWNALLVEPNREAKAADWLKKVNVHVYLPMFKKSGCRRGGIRYRRDCAVMPGLLFCPTIMLEMGNRQRIFDWARVRGFIKTAGVPIVLTKADVELIYRMEAKLNDPDSPVDARGVEIHAGSKVRFINPRHTRLFGEGTVFEVARDKRIGVEVSGLFGGLTKTYIAADEIEVL
jgi:hypothetical protein